MREMIPLTVLSILAFTAVDASAGLDDGRIGYWHLDGNFLDSSGHGNDGVAIGAPSITLGKVGQAYRFDGSVGIDVGNLDFATGQLTVFGWIRTSQPAISESWKTWIDKWTGSDATFQLGIEDGRPQLGDGPHALVWKDAGTVVLISKPEPTLRDGEWHSYAFTFQQGAQRVYIDGINVGEASYAGSLPIVSGNVVIGGKDGGVGALQHPWIGDIDEVSIYERSLSESEVWNLHSIPEPPTVVLLAGGILALLGIRRGKFSNFRSRIQQSCCTPASAGPTGA